MGWPITRVDGRVTPAPCDVIVCCRALGRRHDHRIPPSLQRRSRATTAHHLGRTSRGTVACAVGEHVPGIAGNTCPVAAVGHIAAKPLEGVRSVRAFEEVDAPAVRLVPVAVEDRPSPVDPLRPRAPSLRVGLC